MLRQIARWPGTHLLGVIRKLDITNESTGASKPKADVELTIGVDEINEDGELSPGNNTISARFKKESEGYQTIHPYSHGK